MSEIRCRDPLYVYIDNVVVLLELFLPTYERTYLPTRNLFTKVNSIVDTSRLSPKDFMEPMVLVANSVLRPSFLVSNLSLHSILPSFGNN